MRFLFLGACLLVLALVAITVFLFRLSTLAFAPFRRSAALAAASVILFCSPALAAGAMVNIPQPFLDELNTLIIGIFIALATLIYKWLDNRNPLKNSQADELARDAFTALLNNAARYGLTQLQSGESNVGTVDVGNAAVAAGANFVIAHGPELAAKMGFDINTPEGRAAVIRSVTLRVADMMTPAGEQPRALELPAAVALAGTPTKPNSSS